jgi:histidinol dehydrogenase
MRGDRQVAFVVRTRRFDWADPSELAAAIREWVSETAEAVDVEPIAREVIEGGDAAVLRLTERFDGPGSAPAELRVDADEPARALEGIEPKLRQALDIAAANIRAVAEAQVNDVPTKVELPQGHAVVVQEVPVASAGIYAPGGGAAYPSTVLMGCLPARLAGVGRVAVASPPGPHGGVQPLVLAACALCEVDEV